MNYLLRKYCCGEHNTVQTFTETEVIDLAVECSGKHDELEQYRDRSNVDIEKAKEIIHLYGGDYMFLGEVNEDTKILDLELLETEKPPIYVNQDVTIKQAMEILEWSLKVKILIKDALTDQ